MSTVFVAMSGGFDSSFAARLLKEQGHHVVGFTFVMLPKGMADTDNPKACCSAASVNRARKTAHDLSIQHYVIDLRDEFERHVITRFIDEYRVGRTPNPCILCNTFIKFGAFLDKAVALGADQIATGHYASVDIAPDGPHLRKPADKTKDQSYFLYGIKRDSLCSILFPLASRIKSEAVERVRQQHSHYAGVRESQDICFIPKGDYRAFLGQFVPFKKGDIVSLDGRVLGHHDGVHLYTVGQRRGLRVPYSEPLYVLEIDTASNTVVVGPRERLEKRSLVASGINLFADPRGIRLAGKVRYKQKEQPCSCSIDGDRMLVRFEAPVSSVTAGQSVVLYDGDTVMGGGTIDGAS